MTKITATKKRRREPEIDTEQEKEQEHGLDQEKDGSTTGKETDQDQLELAAAASLVSLTTAPSPATATRSSKPKSTTKARISQNTAAPVVPPSTSSSSASASPIPETAPSASSSLSLPSAAAASSSSNITPQEHIEFLERLERDSHEKIKKLEDKVAKLKENDKVLQSKAEASYRRLKKIREKYKEAEIQLRNQERRIGTLQLELQRAQPQPIVKAPVGTGLRIDKYKRKRGKKLNEDERRLVLHCLEMCRLEQELAPSIATGDPFLRAAVYMGMSTHTVRDTALDRNLEDRRTREDREKRAAHTLQDHVLERNDTKKEGENEPEGIETEEGDAQSIDTTRTPESLCTPPYVPHDLHHVIRQSEPTSHTAESGTSGMLAAYEDF
ncbi:hypothetical protein EMPS_09386 [Entomortierella parvispora]|uniref:Uncharacterized protein n=1 Tax=Entomortierella parvispora TaxID=205924 RepID=A0A9P3HIQ4_9FUNG|nr:hypothetical protein EMPS_09386 [Entomortierella parvispora]